MEMVAHFRFCHHRCAQCRHAQREARDLCLSDCESAGRLACFSGIEHARMHACHVACLRGSLGSVLLPFNRCSVGRPQLPDF